MLLEYDHPLAPHNTLALPARAEWFLRSGSVDEIARQIRASAEQDIPCTVIGEGSNIVLAADIPGLVIQPALRGVEKLSQDADSVVIRAAAGENWDSLVRLTLEKGWYGLENLSLIPGSVGAAPVQNIGAYGCELADYIEQIEALNLEDGELQVFSRACCQFAYRDSFFKSVEPGRWLITSVQFRLWRSPRMNLEYADLQARFQAMPAEKRNPIGLRELVCQLRKSKLPDPAELANVGSFFKNPVVDAASYDELLQQYPDLVAFALPGGKYKLAAGWLIEKAGWKGRRLGPVGMHKRQALVLVNYGGATSSDVLLLASEVVEDIRKMFSVELEQEPVLLPRGIQVATPPL